MYYIVFLVKVVLGPTLFILRVYNNRYRSGEIEKTMINKPTS